MNSGLEPRKSNEIASAPFHQQENEMTILTDNPPNLLEKEQRAGLMQGFQNLKRPYVGARSASLIWTDLRGGHIPGPKQNIPFSGSILSEL